MMSAEQSVSAVVVSAAKRTRSADTAGILCNEEAKKRRTEPSHGSEAAAALSVAFAPGAKGRKASDLIDELLVSSFTWLSAVEIVMGVREVCRRWRDLSFSNGAWSEVQRRFRAMRADPTRIPNPHDSLRFVRGSDVGAEEYDLALREYRTCLEASSAMAVDDLSAALKDLPVFAADLEKFWWQQPRPSLRSARNMWQRVSSEPAIRTVKVGQQNLENQLTWRNTFAEFQHEVSTLWALDLYTELGFFPPVHSRVVRAVRGSKWCWEECLCDMHVHPNELLITGERNYCAPQRLMVNTRQHHDFLSGPYRLLDNRVNGFPCWEREAEDGCQEKKAWLFSSPCGVWTVSNRETDFCFGSGHIASAIRHNGWLPQTNREWMFGDGKEWLADMTISVRTLQDPSAKFLEKQKEVTPRMRATLISWISQMQHWQQGPFPMQVFSLTVLMLDKYLAATLVSKDELQLVACACIVVAHKAECPLIAGDSVDLFDRLVRISDYAYTKEQIVEKADEVVAELGANITRHPTIYLFLERYLDVLREKEDEFEPILQDAAEFIMELAVMQYEVVSRFRVSVIAAAALLVAARVWTPLPLYTFCGTTLTTLHTQTLPVPVPKCVDELSMLDCNNEFCAAELHKLVCTSLLCVVLCSPHLSHTHCAVLSPQVCSARPWVGHKKALAKKYANPDRSSVSMIYDSQAML